MAKFTLVTALVLIILGVAFFVATGSHAPTALIPAYFGIILGILGLLAKTEDSKQPHDFYAHRGHGRIARRHLPGLASCVGVHRIFPRSRHGAAACGEGRVSDGGHLPDLRADVRSLVHCGSSRTSVKEMYGDETGMG